MLESVVELEVVAWAENHGWLARKMKYIGRIGCPDRHFIGYSQIVVIEFKKPGEPPNPQQACEHKRYREKGIKVHVVDNVEEGIEILRFAMRHDVSTETFL